MRPKASGADGNEPVFAACVGVLSGQAAPVGQCQLAILESNAMLPDVRALAGSQLVPLKYMYDVNRRVPQPRKGAPERSVRV